MHIAQDIQTWFAGRPKIEVIPWPPKSPDLNVIEKTWIKLKERRCELLKKILLGIRTSCEVKFLISSRIRTIFSSTLISCLVESEKW